MKTPLPIQVGNEPVDRSVRWMQTGREIAGPDRRYAARCRPPRSSAWLRDNMVKSNEVGLDLREMPPLPRDILHSPEWHSGFIRGSERIQWKTTRQRIIEVGVYQLHDSNRQPDLSCWRSGYHKEWDWSTDNHHLHYLAESLSVHVGGSQQNVKASSLPRSAESVGGARVLGARESRVQGEGHQEIGAPRSAKVKWEGIPVAYAGRLQVFGAKHLVDASQM